MSILLITPDSLPDSDLDLLEDLGPAPLGTASMSLDDLFAESMAEARASESIRAARKAVAGERGAAGGISTEEKRQLQAAIRSWEVRREWQPAAAVVMFARQQCKGCGEFHTQFLGYFQRQVHRNTKIDRWIPSIKPQSNDMLLREAKYQDSHSEMCEACADLAGFAVEEY